MHIDKTVIIDHIKDNKKRYFIAIIGLLLILFLFRNCVFKNTSKEINTFSPLVLERINQIKQIMLTTFYLEGVYKRKAVDSSDYKFIMVYRGTVTAGIDFSKFNKSSIQQSGEIITIDFQLPKITDVILNPSGYESILDADSLNHEQLEQEKIKIKEVLKQKAIRLGIIKYAKQRADSVLRNFFKLLGIENVKIRFIS